jgi:predicted nucleic acid-binding protein
MLVDTSVWVDHLRRNDPTLSLLLRQGEVECHPFIIGELACGSLNGRTEVLSLLEKLPQSQIASHNEVLDMVERHRLFGHGIGWIDAHLLASSLLARSLLWTRDRHLAKVVRSLNLGWEP